MSTIKTAPFRRILAGTVAATALLGPLTACGAGASAAGGEVTTIRYQSSQGTVDALQFADALGELKGLKLKKVGDVTGGPQSIQALASNQIDIGASCFFGAIAQTVAAGVPIKAVVATYGTNEKTGAAVVAKKGAGLTDDPHSFIGKKIAVNTLGANAEAVLDTWFAKGGLTREDIKKVTLVPLPPLNTAQALKQGQVDGAYIGIGQLKAAQEAVDLDVVFRDSDVIGYYNGGGFTMRDEFIQKNPKVSKEIVTGVSRAVDYIESHSREDVLKIYTKWLDENGFHDYIEAVEKNWSGSNGVSSKGGVIADKDISIWLDWLGSRGDVDPSKTTPSDVYTNKFNPSA